MIAGAFDNGSRARIAHGKALAGHAAEIALARDGAIKHGVTGNDAFFRLRGGVFRRADDDFAAGQALAHVVVGLAGKIERDAVRKPGAEAGRPCP